MFCLSARPSAPVFNGDDTIVVNGKQYKACACNVQYKITTHQQAKSASLVDRGANGGLAGSDVKVLDKSDRKVTITGIDNHQVRDLDIVTAAGKVLTTKGYVVVILHGAQWFPHSA